MLEATTADEMYGVRCVTDSQYEISALADEFDKLGYIDAEWLL